MNAPLAMPATAQVIREKRCENCKHINPVQGQPLGECRRNPPIIAPIIVNGQVRFVTEFARVHPVQGWCGEHAVRLPGLNS